MKKSGLFGVIGLITLSACQTVQNEKPSVEPIKQNETTVGPDIQKILTSGGLDVNSPSVTGAKPLQVATIQQIEQQRETGVEHKREKQADRKKKEKSSKKDVILSSPMNLTPVTPLEAAPVQPVTVGKIGDQVVPVASTMATSGISPNSPIPQTTVLPTITPQGAVEPQKSSVNFNFLNGVGQDARVVVPRREEPSDTSSYNQNREKLLGAIVDGPIPRMVTSPLYDSLSEPKRRRSLSSRLNQKAGEDSATPPVKKIEDTGPTVRRF